MNTAVTACGPTDFYFTAFSNPLDHFLIENQFLSIGGSLEQEIAPGVDTSPVHHGHEDLLPGRHRGVHAA